MGTRFDVVTVAPASEMSGVSHAITLTRPLSVDVIEDGLHAVDGTPTDCVNIALHRILPRAPDACVSGVNHGANMGDDVGYSATVGAAFEAALFGIPSVAVSQLRGAPHADFGVAAELAVSLVTILADGAVRLPPGTFLNVNVPDGPPRGLSATRLARRVYLDPIEEHGHPGGRTFYWVGGRPKWQSDPGTDHHAVVQLQHASVTLLGTDLSLAVPRDEGTASSASLLTALLGSVRVPWEAP